jgi:Pyridoxamine 5'-phosphate oxidase
MSAVRFSRRSVVAAGMAVAGAALATPACSPAGKAPMKTPEENIDMHGGDALPNDKARAILDRINYITLATVDEHGRPWNAPVYYAYDHAYRAYWGSHVGSQHSRNIRRNAHGFIVVYDSTAPPGTGEGVYIDAHCVELSHPDDIAAAHQVIQARHATPYWTLEEVQGDAPVRLYRADPKRIWMNDGGHENGVYIDVRATAEQ